ncbi:glycosyl hydrolase [Lewinella sp. JB7]|uniref:glycosyl hydrolase n=1 Tax=Lewinella sp. JB7 TaxID=2962887 RepID=UPI0020C997B9|nr:glycosyl hydrolase [Lewinella sp. JB7]MCP9235995.1 hypothetical protein [Lewinella sp. JB7]
MRTVATLFYTVCWAMLVPLSGCVGTVSESTRIPDWPEITSENRIWTRWWWHGSAVTQAGITAELESLREAGFGGVELTPIFGVIGEEESFVSYLSPAWMELLGHTLREADRLGMRVDMATGTGWPFGGPWVGREDAAKYLAHRTYELSGGQQLADKIEYRQEPIFRRVENRVLRRYRAARVEKLPATSPVEADKQSPAEITLEDIDPDIKRNADLQGLALDQLRFPDFLPLISLVAYGSDGAVINLTDQVADSGTLDWTAPAGNWKLYALFRGLHGKMVERAAPGGEGNVIDHFSGEAITNYLSRFDEAFRGQNIGGLRAFFNDSYEVDDARGQANWTPALLEEFERRRGYDLREHLPALFGEADAAENARVLSDYRETFSDLILENFTAGWAEWAGRKGAIVRNQAHGSPANILDLYAASTIPETEGTQSLRIKFATSAANVTGKPLVSAEAATWLDEHFVANWADLKANLDQYLVNGVNHLVYHGTAYSPPDDEFPGRLFYAAFHANNRHPMWDDLTAVNTYVSRVQSMLQRGTSDNDILLYFPAYDRYATPGPELLQHFDGHGPHLDETPVAEVGEALLAAGYTFDFISDRQLRTTTYEAGIRTAGGTYGAVLVPKTEFMPLETLRQLTELARAGATLIFQGALPTTVPGYHEWERREREFQSLTREIAANTSAESGIVVADDYLSVLPRRGIDVESMVARGLTFNRRNYAGGTLYFISNWSAEDVDDMIALAAPGAAAVLFDPMTGSRGVARTVVSANSLSARLQVPRGGSVFLWVSPKAVDGDPWPYFGATGQPMVVGDTWQLKFTKGGALLPPSLELPAPRVWNGEAGAAYRYFSGTGRYTTTFPRPAGTASGYLLDLGRVHETARVSLNGTHLATLIGPTYRIALPAERLREHNTLTVDVSNRWINRIIQMDREGIFWKKFYNVNLPARLRENVGPLGIFDASGWDPVPSGLAGPVTLTAGRLPDK